MDAAARATRRAQVAGALNLGAWRAARVVRRVAVESGIVESDVVEVVVGDLDRRDHDLFIGLDGDVRLVYLGALHYSRDKPIDYGKDTERDQVAYVFRTGPQELRMEFPAPKFESKLDILELKR